jgi:hypothetical protein
MQANANKCKQMQVNGKYASEYEQMQTQAQAHVSKFIQM